MKQSACTIKAAPGQHFPPTRGVNKRREASGEGLKQGESDVIQSGLNNDREAFSHG